MGSELVNPASPHITYARVFYDNFPFYLSIGMTYDQYWNEDNTLTIYYRKAFELEKSRKNQELWLQGLYFYEALCDVSPVLQAFAKAGTKPLPYLDKPYALSAKEIKEQKETIERENRKKAMAMFSRWAERFKEHSREEVIADGNN
ncbi:MAG: hypothetical protein GYA36_22755 [Veillonellaceae bacterium]|nr:hypothetical protein [Veillonellaceae bacterium]